MVTELMLATDNSRYRAWNLTGDHQYWDKTHTISQCSLILPQSKSKSKVQGLSQKSRSKLSTLTSNGLGVTLICYETKSGT